MRLRREPDVVARDAAPRIALVKLSSLGDVVHALPVAQALRDWWPRADISWIVERREQAILLGNPSLDRVIPVDTRLWRRELRRPPGAHAVLAELGGVARQLRGGRFDVALDLQGLWKSGVITGLTGAPVRVGLAVRHCRERANVLFTNRRVAPPAGAVHVVEQYLALLGALGVGADAVRDPRFPIAVDPESEERIARYLEEEGVKPETSLVALNPGAGGDGKRWTLEAYRRVGDELALRLGARVVVCWGPAEEPLARGIAHGMRSQPLVPPPTSIPDMVALLRRTALVVGGDTGPVHVAAALGVATLGLYGPTSGLRNGPYGPRTAFVQSPSGRMEDIAVEAVLRAAEELGR